MYPGKTRDKRTTVEKMFDDLLWFSSLSEEERLTWNRPGSPYPLFHKLIKDGVFTKPAPEVYAKYYLADYADLWEAYTLHFRYTRSSDRRQDAFSFLRDFYDLIRIYQHQLTGFK